MPGTRSGAQESGKGAPPAPQSPGGGRVVGAVDAATVQILSALQRLDERLTRSEEATAARFAALDQAGQEVVAGVEALQIQADNEAAAAIAAQPSTEDEAPPPYEAPPEPEGEGGGGPGPRRIANLSEEALKDLIAASVQEASQKGHPGVEDTVPHQGGVPKLPRRIFEAQERGELVPTNLLTAVEYANCITGYKTLPEGTQAELDYLYVGTRRLDDVLRHLDDAIDGVIEADIQRLREVVGEVSELHGERARLLVKRAFVKGTPQDEHRYTTDRKVVQELKDARAKRRRPAEVDEDQITELEKAIEYQLSKQIATAHAKALFKDSGLGKPGKKQEDDDD